MVRFALVVLLLASGCSSSLSRADYEKKYAAELKDAKETLAAIQGHLDKAAPAPLDAPCELRGATLTQVSPPEKVGTLEAMSEFQLLDVLDPERGKKLLADRHGQRNPPVRVLDGPLQRLADPQKNPKEAFESEIRAAELSRGVTHVLVTRGGEDENPQFFLFDAKQRTLVCSYSLTVEVPANIVEEDVKYQTVKDGVVVGEASGKTRKAQTYFRDNIRAKVGSELKRRFGI